MQAGHSMLPSMGDVDESLSTPGAGPSRSTPSNDQLPSLAEENEDVIMNEVSAAPSTTPSAVDIGMERGAPPPFMEEDPDSSDLSDLSDGEHDTGWIESSAPKAGADQLAVPDAMSRSVDILSDVVAAGDAKSRQSSSTRPTAKSRPKFAHGKAASRSRNRIREDSGNIAQAAIITPLDGGTRGEFLNHVVIALMFKLFICSLG